MRKQNGTTSAVAGRATRKVKTERQGPVLTIRLSSVATRNSLDQELIEQLRAAIEEADESQSVRAVFLTADGPAFCAGGNLKMGGAEAEPWPVHRRGRAISCALLPLMSLEKPVVVGLNGPAIGGGLGLALSGDIVLAAESATLSVGWFRIGAMPDMGVLYHLPRLVGMARAKNFLFGGGTMTAVEAAEQGLVHRVVPDERLAEEGFSEAMRLAEGPAQVMGLAKAMLARSFETTLADMLAFEGYGQVMAMSNNEFKEGISAAQEKRAPDFVRAVERFF